MAGRPRTPTNVLKLRGADKKHPERMKDRKNEPVNTHPIGDPPGHLNKTEKAAWHELVDKSCEGVFGKADSFAVEIAAQLLVKLRHKKFRMSPEGKRVIDLPGPQDHTMFFRYLSQFGMTPADRSKISIPEKPDKNPFDDD